MKKKTIKKNSVVVVGETGVTKTLFLDTTLITLLPIFIDTQQKIIKPILLVMLGDEMVKSLLQFIAIIF